MAHYLNVDVSLSVRSTSAYPWEVHTPHTCPVEDPPGDLLAGPGRPDIVCEIVKSIGVRHRSGFRDFQARQSPVRPNTTRSAATTAATDRPAGWFRINTANNTSPSTIKATETHRGSRGTMSSGIPAILADRTLEFSRSTLDAVGDSGTVPVHLEERPVRRGRWCAWRDPRLDRVCRGGGCAGQDTAKAEGSNGS